MSTISESRSAMGPVFQAWLPQPKRVINNFAQHQCHTTFAAGAAWPSQSQEKTKVPVKHRAIKHPKTVIMEYLEAHGATTSKEFESRIGITKMQLRWASGKLPGVLLNEQVGKGAERVTLYWSVNRPPSLSQRSNTFKTYDFFLKNPWLSVKDIPIGVVSRRGAHTYACDLERNGKLKSRVRNKIKQYKAVFNE